MKKFISMLLVGVMCISLCACGGNDTETTEPKEDENMALEIGDTYTSDSVEFTLERFEMAQMLSNTMDDTFLLPDDITEFASAERHPYFAEDGNVMVSYSYTINNVGKEEIDTVLWTIELDYNDGYTYESETLDNDAFLSDGEWKTTTAGRTVAPLATKESRGFLEVPLEVSENTEAPLKVNVHIFTVTDNKEEAAKNLGGVNYKETIVTYNVR